MPTKGLSGPIDGMKTCNLSECNDGENANGSKLGKWAVKGNPVRGGSRRWKDEILGPENSAQLG